MELSIDRRETPEVLVLAVAGRLDAEHAGELACAVDEELRRGHHTIALDLTDCGFLSSAGIRVLFEIHRSAKGVGGSCLIRAASEPIRKVLDLTRLTPLLMEPAAGQSFVSHTAAHHAPAVVDVRCGTVQFIGLERPGPAPLRGRLVGSADAALSGRMAAAERVPLSRHAFALGLAALADTEPLADRAGEMLGACGTAFHRRPQPFSAIDYVAATADLVPDVDVAAGLVWEGIPAGRAGFEAADEADAVTIDDLVAGMFEHVAGDTVAIVVVSEVHGLVGAELIRPLAEASAIDRPGSPRRDIAARWLSFSREPVHARRTALIVGVATRGPTTGPLAAFVRPLSTGATQGHFHATVFPLRPLKRGSGDVAATVADVTASEPLALLHLLGDPQPVLGSGRSQFVRGRVWFAPLVVAGARA
ncbi:MAG: STAS domain-containing protein [Pirellulales bacterium]